jgi:hypothetical protein
MITHPRRRTTMAEKIIPFPTEQGTPVTTKEDK